MKKILALSIAAAVMIAPAYSQDKETDDQIKHANEAAKNVGLRIPDAKELTEKSDKVEAKEKAAAQPTVQAAMDAKGPVALPDWTPPVPEFIPSGPVARKLVDGKPQIILIGTSPLAPDALVDAWAAYKNPKVGHERSGSDINHNVDLFFTLRNGEDGTEVKMEAERQADAKLTHVTISSPLPIAASPSKENQ
jgi:hypothetical protein